MAFFPNMRITKTSCILLVMGATILAAEEKQPLPAPTPPENDSLTQQMRSVVQMQTSIETQRQTVKRQVPPRAPGQPFFLSPPPAHTLHPIEGAYPIESAEVPCDPLPAGQVDSLVGDAAKREELDPALLRSVMEQESAFRPCALSPKGAMGLMQLMPATAAQLGVRDPFDPGQSIDGGARFLKQLLQTFGGDVPLALGAYNAGPGKVSEANGIPQIPETIDYVRRVMSLLPALE